MITWVKRRARMIEAFYYVSRHQAVVAAYEDWVWFSCGSTAEAYEY